MAETAPGIGTPSPIQYKEGYEHVIDGYIKYTDVLFEWHKMLDPWHVNALKGLVNIIALTHPDHPLATPGDGFGLFIGTDENGHKRLLFSLRQIEYLRYWIHEMRLTDPKRVMELSHHRDEPPREPSAEDSQEFARPIEEIEVEEWIPLPNAILKAESFVSIEPTRVHSKKDVDKLLRSFKKTSPPCSYSSDPIVQNRIAAKIDNATPGPGLRRGPPRQRECRNSRRKSEDLQESLQAGVGWGGFPLRPNVEDKAEPNQETERTKVDSTDKIPSDTTQERSGKAESAKSVEEAIVPQNPSSANEASAVIPDDPVQSAVNESSAPAPTLAQQISQYHFDAEQALILASQGGLAGLFRLSSTFIPKPNSDSDSDDETEIVALRHARRTKIGRSLSIALNVTTWEEDEAVVLEVGWAAVWFQEKLKVDDTSSGKGDTVKDGKGEDEQVDRFEEVRDLGHWIVHDHLLSRRNGHKKPDHRSKYHFGNSIPVAQKDLNSAIERKIQDLSRRAGEGPIFFIIHSSNQGTEEMQKLGLDTANWMTELHPNGWEYPIYSSEEGVGVRAIIDTALLFTSIDLENCDDTVSNVLKPSQKSLEEIGAYLFEKDANRKIVDIGNAGNAAVYTLETFMSMVAESPLDLLRAQYGLYKLKNAILESPSRLHPPPPTSTLPITKSTNEPISTVSDETNVPEKMADNDSDDSEEEREIEPFDEEEDSEDERIGGVFIENENGELINHEDFEGW